MILVLAGTLDGRNLVAKLSELGLPVFASVVSEYGRALLDHGATRVFCEELDQPAMERLLREHTISLLIDATHPYAVNVTRNAAAAAQIAGVEYLRYERPELTVPDYDRLVTVADMNEAVETCLKLGRIWYLTIGSRHVRLFADAAKSTGCRIIARVLPQPDVIAQCLETGLSPADIIAMQGPFSQELNEILFRESGADLMVTKSSGEIGGTAEKIQAAMALGLAVVMVRRPCVSGLNSFSSIDAIVDYVRRSHSV